MEESPQLESVSEAKEGGVNSDDLKERQAVVEQEGAPILPIDLFFHIDKLDLAPGQSHRLDCPFCNGGKNKEKKTFGVYRVEDNTKHSDGYFYKCFRASCTGSSGFMGINTSDSDTVFADANMVKDEVKPPNYQGFHYPGRTTTITNVWMEGLQGAYPQLTLDAMCQCGVKLLDEEHFDNLVVPLNTSRHGFEAGGYHIRSMWPGGQKRTYWAPHMQKRGSGAWFTPRTQASRNFEQEASLYRTEQCQVVAVVEDALSALVLGNYAPTYCLLGTGLGGAALVDITQNVDAVLLYLDPDTWERVPGQRYPTIITVINKLLPRVLVIPRKLDQDPKYLDNVWDMMFEDTLKAYKAYGVFRGN